VDPIIAWNDMERRTILTVPGIEPRPSSPQSVPVPTELESGRLGKKAVDCWRKVRRRFVLAGMGVRKPEWTRVAATLVGVVSNASEENGTKLTAETSD
jgi:hypothetical protein